MSLVDTILGRFGYVKLDAYRRALLADAEARVGLSLPVLPPALALPGRDDAPRSGPPPVPVRRVSRAVPRRTAAAKPVAAVAPEPAAAPEPVAAPEPAVAPVAAIAPVPAPAPAPEPAREEDEWEWRLAIARARARDAA